MNHVDRFWEFLTPPPFVDEPPCMPCLGGLWMPPKVNTQLALLSQHEKTVCNLIFTLLNLQTKLFSL